MSTIYAISPDYLYALHKESLDFYFKLQGYGNLKDACEGLIYLNAKDLIGITYVANDFPKDTKQLELFCEKCRLLAKEPVFFLFAIVENKSGLSDFINKNKSDNLKFMTLTNIEVVTDRVIRRDIFGSLLLNKYEPYNFHKKESIANSNFIPRLQFTQLFSEDVLCIFDPPVESYSLESCLKLDSLYEKLKGYDAFLAKLRECIIALKFNKYNPAMLARLSQELESITDVTDYCTKAALLQMIKEKVSGRSTSNLLI